MKGHKILCTLGPSSLNEQVIKKLSTRGVDYFRINMSHTTIDELKEHIKTIRKYSDTPICIDSEGAQVRTGYMEEGTILQDRKHVTLVKDKEVGNSNIIPLWPDIMFDQLRTGSLLTVDFDSILLLVIEVEKERAEAIVINGGSVGNNKAVTLFPPPTLPPLSEKDIAAVKVGLENGIKDFALSFANSADDIIKFRKFTGMDARIISKIESKKGVTNLDSILEVTDAILIDRGDLSREVPLENIPLLQKAIIKKANSFHTDVYVATNLLESMMVNRKPTRAELNDVMNTLIDGASGLVLAAETAIGKQPVAAVDMLRMIIQSYKASLNGYRISDLLEHKSSLLPEQHGSTTIVENDVNINITNQFQYDVLEIDENSFLDVVQIAQGTYSPLRGFMNKGALESVLDHYKLEDGQIWPIPIILQINENKWRNLKPGMTVHLKAVGHIDINMYLKITELYKIDLESVAQRWFGTCDIQHPGVRKLFKLGPCVVGGEIEYSNYEGDLKSHYLLTPDQTRMIFNIKGWSKIVGFHTRNVPHKAHEYIIKMGLERSNADGVLIQPVIGPKKKGDFVAEVILGAYDIFIKSCLPGAILCGFSTYSRYSGPREAVFTALCRKNYGCTHFIVGRDHTGVGDYYKHIPSNKLFDDLGDIGIQIIYFDKVQFSEKFNRMVEADDREKGTLNSISGTEIRDALFKGKSIPESVIDSNIVHYLRDRLDNGEPVFVD